MQLIRTSNWTHTTQGDPRGYIDPHGLQELWFHTGTACNLSCPFCLEGSGPADKRLELVKLADLQPFIDEALGLGVEQFSFTGGEPFLAKDLIKILAYASEHRPCLVLTNATEPLQRRFEKLRPLLESAHPISFRVSLDYPDEKQHDAGRGAGNFRKALAGLKMLQDAGFHVSIARQMTEGEDRDAVNQAYAEILDRHGVVDDIPFVVFPDFSTPGATRDVPQVTSHCMTTYQSKESRGHFMCASSKMVVKKAGQMRVYACTLVDDDPEYDFGATLSESMAIRVSMKHHRCFSCFSYGSSCSER